MSDEPTNEEIQPITRADVESFARKLETWGDALPVAERGALALLLAQAQAGNASDVQGYLYNLSQSLPLNVTGHLSPLIARGIGVSGNMPGSNTMWLDVGWQQGKPPQIGF